MPQPAGRSATRTGPGMEAHDRAQRGAGPGSRRVGRQLVGDQAVQREAGPDAVVGRHVAGQDAGTRSGMPLEIEAGGLWRSATLPRTGRAGRPSAPRPQAPGDGSTARSGRKARRPPRAGRAARRQGVHVDATPPQAGLDLDVDREGRCAGRRGPRRPRHERPLGGRIADRDREPGRRRVPDPDRPGSDTGRGWGRGCPRPAGRAPRPGSRRTGRRHRHGPAPRRWGPPRGRRRPP